MDDVEAVFEKLERAVTGDRQRRRALRPSRRTSTSPTPDATR